jgi:SNF2 family DNA or RNA helicase
MRRYVFKTKPYNHQVLALRKLLKKTRGGGLFMEMGTGKTKVAIDYACCKEIKREITQVLVLGPLSTLGVWDSEIRKHAPETSKLHWKVINYDKARLPHYLSQLRVYCQKAPTLLICDEAHKLKNPQSKQSKAAYVLSKLCVSRLVLTGTPITKHPLDLFGEIRVVDDGILGSSWGVFKKTYGMWGGYGGYQLIKYMNLKQLRKRVDDWIFVAKKEDCLDLPSRAHEIIPVHLQKSRPCYEQMARDSMVEFETGAISEAPIILTRLMRLSQCTGGYLRSTEGNYIQVGAEKQEAFNALVANMAEQDVDKIVVFVRFLNELRDAAGVCAKHGYHVLPFYGGVNSNVRQQRIAEFDERQGPTAFIAQISAGSLGISLVASSTAIFYSHSYDYAEFAQACDRLHRIGQKHPVTYYHLICQDTIDEVVWLSLKTKRNIAEIVLSRPELLT